MASLLSKKFMSYRLQKRFRILNINEKRYEISVDEQTLKFQGHHVDKLRISYKREGDGFQCDALCNDGYTFAFYFKNNSNFTLLTFWDFYIKYDIKLM